MSELEDNFKYLDSSEQVASVLSIEHGGKLNEAKELLEKILHEYCLDRNSKKVQEILNKIKDRKVYRKQYFVYRICCDIITGKFQLDSIIGLRESHFDFQNEQRTLSFYKGLLLDVFKLFPAHLDFIKNEIQLISFIEKIIIHDDKSKLIDEFRMMDFRKSWLIKQLALFPRDRTILNYSALALIHSSEAGTAKLLYRYMVTNRIMISTRLKYWVELNSWEIENLYKKAVKDDLTHVFQNEISDLKIDELLSKSEQPFLERNEYKEILDSYQLAIPKNNDDKRNELEEQLIISYGDQGITGRINFYLENAFYKEAYKLAYEQIEYAQQHESLDFSENLNWFYLSLLALLMKNDYNKAIEFTDKYEHYWKLLGAKAVDLWYLSAEANFYSGHFEKAQHYYLQINKFSPDYQLTKARLEEIKAHK